MKNSEKLKQINRILSFNKNSGKSQRNTAFTLAEVLIVLGIIGIIAEMTIPALIENTQHQEWVAGVLKFYSTINQAVSEWKTGINCYDTAYNCLLANSAGDNACSNFDQIAKYLSVADSTNSASDEQTTSLSWLPANTYGYDGTLPTGSANIWEGDSNITWGCKYLLKDGMTLNVDTDPYGSRLYIDVNGAKPPNRIGKDVYALFIGEISNSNKDVQPDDPASLDPNLCVVGTSDCVPGNINPTINNGAMPTSYVLLNKKIPNYYP